MSWKEVDRVDLRMQLVADWLSGKYSKAALARRYEVTRPTAHKWIDRFEKEGPEGLADRRSSPHESPNRTPDSICERIIEAKQARPNWGPKKLIWWLAKEDPDTPWPAPSTAGELLDRMGLVTSRKRKRRTPANPSLLSISAVPNQTWCTDFKGQFRTGNGKLCYPLTLTDNHSRYLLRCQSLLSTHGAPCRAVFESAFREFGLPDYMRSDNGAPFASTGLAGLSQLAVWLMCLDIIPERIAPGRPDQNGRHERMHKTLKAETTQPPERNWHRQQGRFNTFRQDFNHERPHESLGMQPPAACYEPSARRYPERVVEHEYEAAAQVRRVRSNGQIKWRGDLVYVSQALIGHRVAVAENEAEQWELRFRSCRIGIYNPSTKRFDNV